MRDESFLLRAAKREDSEFLTTMLVEAVNWRPGRDAVSREQILADGRAAHYIADWPRAEDLGVVAVSPDGQPIGAVWLRLFSADDPGYGFVGPEVPELSLAVVKPWRGKGVGRALLREAIRRAADAGFDQISLSVERSNPATRLYREEGFTTVESGTDSDTMVKILAVPDGLSGTS